MDRRELVRQMVLSEISDDYENVDQVVLPSVARDAAKCGLTIGRSDIIDALAGLIKDGLARPYRLSSREPFSTELQGMPALDVVEENYETYFYATKQGRELQLSSDSPFPYDEDGNLRPDWHLGPPTKQG